MKYKFMIWFKSLSLEKQENFLLIEVVVHSRQSPYELKESWSINWASYDVAHDRLDLGCSKFWVLYGEQIDIVKLDVSIEFEGRYYETGLSWAELEVELQV